MNPTTVIQYLAIDAMESVWRANGITSPND